LLNAASRFRVRGFGTCTTFAMNSSNVMSSFSGETRTRDVPVGFAFFGIRR
jgi:hypothetical protein